MQTRMKILTSALALGMFGVVAATMPAQAEVQKYNFEVVGTWGFLENWKSYESKFWNE